MSVETIILTSQKDVPPSFCCTSPRQYPGKYLGLSFKTVKTWPTKNVGAGDIVLEANLTKIFLIYIDVQLTSETCEYDTMYIPMRIFLWGKKKTQHHRHSPPSKNSHLETGGRIEEEQQQSSHIPLS